jgi:hypothetical protein
MGGEGFRSFITIPLSKRKLSNAAFERLTHATTNVGSSLASSLQAVVYVSSSPTALTKDFCPNVRLTADSYFIGGCLNRYFLGIQIL